MEKDLQGKTIVLGITGGNRRLQNAQCSHALAKRGARCMCS